MIKGQEKLVSYINKFNINNFPHSILLLGESGSGQEKICEYISDKFDLFNLSIITENVSHEMLNSLLIDCTSPTLVTIDVNKITEKEQSMLLKLFEEPNNFIYIILIAETYNDILETLINRSYIFKLDGYSKEQLMSDILTLDQETRELILETCHTPGQVDIASHTNMKQLFVLCMNILDKIGRANLYNTISISDKINFSDEYSKYDLKLFIRTLLYAMKLKNNFKFFDELNQMNRYIDFITDKKSYFENFLIKAWEISRK